jgi:uncharacterized membrane protein YqhA
MNKVLSSTRYLAFLAVLGLLVTSLTAFGWGLFKTYEAVRVIFSQGGDSVILVALIEVVDVFLLATALLIFAYGLYELFIGDLNLPDWIQVHNLHDLKAKLGGILILVMAVKFLEKLAEWKDAQQTLFFALAIAVIAAVLIAFNAFGGKD